MSEPADNMEVVFQASRAKHFTAAFLMVLVSWLSLTRSTHGPSLGKLSLIFSVAALLIALALAVLPLVGKPSLKLTQMGLYLVSPIGQRFFAWSDCCDFYVKNMFGLQMISFLHFGAELGITNLFDAPSREIVYALQSFSSKFANAT